MWSSSFWQILGGSEKFLCDFPSTPKMETAESFILSFHQFAQAKVSKAVNFALRNFSVC